MRVEIEFTREMSKRATGQVHEMSTEHQPILLETP